MTITDILLALLIIGTIGVIYILLRGKNSTNNGNKPIEENAQLKAELTQKDVKIGELTKDFQNERTKKDELSGKNKQLYAEIVSLKAKNENLLEDKERLSKELAKFKEEETRKENEFNIGVQKLDESKKAWEDEKKRVRREDEERDKKEKEERDRMWAEHEKNVKYQLSELCKLPEYNYQTYDNNNLPDGFGGKFKPDFMIEFLGQYVIFDAKVSRSDNLQNYVSTNVKSTIEKINNDTKIYPMIFFVVPTDAIGALNKKYFYEKGYEVFIISPDTIPVVLATFKRISAYELAEGLDPRDRENIVSLIAEFDYHINMRNALDLLASQSGVSVLEKGNNLSEDIKSEITRKKSKMRLQQFAPTDIKTLMINSKMQQRTIDEMTSPKASISNDDLDSVKPILEEKNKSA
ncbi:hypothetical protein J7J83_03815 [bacterium]|nr:hypothetical protein [bacterium]